MTDLPAENGAGSVEQKTLPVPSFASPASDSAGASQVAFNEDALLAKMWQKYEPEIDRKLQGQKDKRFAKLDQMAPVLDGFREYLDRNKGDYDAALRDFKIDRAYEASQTPAPATTPAPVQGRTEPAEDPSAIAKWTTDTLTNAGIAFDDPGYEALADADWTMPNGQALFKKAVSNMTEKRRKQAIQPGAATAAGDGGSGRAPGVQDKGQRIESLTRQVATLNPATQAAEFKKATLALEALLRS